ncbi:helix-turn-helix transcriptional regulator [Pedobacter insulae]|uniref:HTH domain-containing protein n=1 Tax=Pedobacter insulae TaxID=414048 RepID=A0A1I2YX93_9SPHI|nr:YafY family protein [Pedobacter insulae]SFH30253.1 HTH domain-containing protein [Pedobacter insulae]
MNRIDRLFGILILLQSKKYTTTERIAEQYGISIRTVYRDIKALSEQGIPLSFEPNKGYFIVHGYFLPPVSFNSDEANALLLMERFLEGFADKSILTHYTTALNKVKNVLRSAQREKLETLNEHIKLQLPGRLKNDYEYLSLIQNAISAQCIIEINYKNNKAETSKREVEPIGLVFYAFHWHLIAWCHLRNEYRDFKLNNIINVNCTDIPFRKMEHMPISDYMKLLPVNF